EYKPYAAVGLRRSSNSRARPLKTQIIHRAGFPAVGVKDNAAGIWGHNNTGHAARTKQHAAVNSSDIQGPDTHGPGVVDQTGNAADNVIGGELGGEIAAGSVARLDDTTSVHAVGTGVVLDTPNEYQLLVHETVRGRSRERRGIVGIYDDGLNLTHTVHWVHPVMPGREKYSLVAVLLWRRKGSMVPITSVRRRTGAERSI